MTRYKFNQIFSRCAAGIRISQKGRYMLVLALAFSCSIQEQETGDQEIVFRAEKLMALQLPDRSWITLTRGSEISYPQNFGDTIREMELKGEAFFEVTHDPRRKFIVHCNTVSTAVLGTSFSIKLSPRNGDVAVTVAHGKVNVSDSNYDYGNLVSRQQVVVTPSIHKAYHAYVDVNKALSWYYESAVLTDRAMASAISVLEGRYKTRIVLENKALSDCLVSINPDYNENLDVILSILAASVNARVVKKDDGYVIKGGLCE